MRKNLSRCLEAEAGTWSHALGSEQKFEDTVFVFVFLRTFPFALSIPAEPNFAKYLLSPNIGASPTADQESLII